MNDMKRKIDRALGQQPDYRRLDNLSNDVWQRIDASTRHVQESVIFPMPVRAGALALCVLAILALSQVSFQEDRYQADIFDLRYFSYQSVPSLNLASINTYEITP